MSSIIRILICIIGVVIAARITIELPVSTTTIPISGQSLAVLLACMFLKPWEAFVAMSSYLLLGIMGLPVFADGASGIEKLQGGSGGFLYGFIIVGVFVSILGQKGWRTSFIKAFLAMFLGTALLLFIGNAHLANKYGWAQALEYGFFPFWKGGLIKVLLGASLVVLFEYLRGKYLI